MGQKKECVLFDKGILKIRRKNMNNINDFGFVKKKARVKHILLCAYS